MSTHREYPILFKPEMVRAILEGRKTETRRLVTVHWHKGRRCLPYEPYYIDQDGELLAMDDQGDYHPMAKYSCPYGDAGDTLWVRETHALEDNRMTGHSLPAEYGEWRPVLWEEDGEETEDGWAETWTVVHYKATDEPPDLCCESPRCRVCREDEYGPHWRPSIHLPRWACGLLLCVEEVRVERLQEISEEGALAEGVTAEPLIYREGDEDHNRRREEIYSRYGQPVADTMETGERDVFAHLWDEINASRAPWSDNPWVWVVQFSPIRDELWSARAS